MTTQIKLDNKQLHEVPTQMARLFVQDTFTGYIVAGYTVAKKYVEISKFLSLGEAEREIAKITAGGMVATPCFESPKCR